MELMDSQIVKGKTYEKSDRKKNPKLWKHMESYGSEELNQVSSIGGERNYTRKAI